MGKEHFPQLLVYQPVVFIGGQSHVFQGKALHLAAVSVPALQRHQRRPQPGHAVSQFFRHGVARPVGAGEGVGQPPGAQGRGPALDKPLVRGHPGHIVGVVGYGEDPVASFHL